GEDDLRAERPIEADPPRGRGVVVRERAEAAGLAVALAEAGGAPEIVDPRLARLEGGGADVGRVEEAPREQPLLVEQDGERVGLLAGAAAGDPGADERVGREARQDLAPEREEVRRVAEHFAHLDGEE